MFEYHIRVTCEENYQVQLLGFVGKAYNILAGYDFEQEEKDCDQVQEVPDQLKHIHYNLDYITFPLVLNIHH